MLAGYLKANKKRPQFGLACASDPSNAGVTYLVLVSEDVGVKTRRPWLRPHDNTKQYQHCLTTLGFPLDKYL